MSTYHVKRDTLAVAGSNGKLNFPRFFREVDKVASGLYALGVKKGDVVVLALPNIVQLVVTVYALSKLGAVASMIHPLLSGDEFEAAVKKQHPKVVFLSIINGREFKKRLHGEKTVFCTYLTYNYVGLPKGENYEEYRGNGDEDMFYMQSGGTSGEPKTVVLSSKACNAMAGNLLNYLDDKFDDKNRMFVALPMFHGFGLCVGVHAPLCANMGVVLSAGFKAKKTVKLIKKYHVTTMLAVPRMVEKLLACPTFGGKRIESLEDVYVGGDAVSRELIDAFQKRIEESGGHGLLSAGYGLSETVTVCTLTKGSYVNGSVGNPILNVGVKIVDDELHELPVGEVGELLLSGDQLMSRYLDDEEATKQALVKIDGNTWVRTGDLFRTDEQGRLFYLGRKKRLIKISGINVFPSEIERVVRELDFIKECAVIEYRVNGKPYIRVLAEGELTEDKKKEVISYVAKRLSHWNTPSSVVCVKEFPRTKMGKIDIRTLEQLYS